MSGEGSDGGDNPFDDMADGMNDSTEESAASTTTTTDEEPPATTSDAVDSTSQVATNGHSDSQQAENGSSSTTSRYTEYSSKPELEHSSPSFGYNQVSQGQVYLRDGLLVDLDDFKHEIELQLRREFGVRNVEGREIDTALIQVVLREIDVAAVVGQVITNRGFDPNQ